MKRIFTLVIAMTAVCGAHATNLTITGMTTGLYQSVKVEYKGQTKNVLAGPQAVSINGKAPQSLYCIDFDHWNQIGSKYDVTVKGTNSLSNGSKVANLMTNFWSTIDTKTEATAFQLALWDAVVDGGDGLAVGNFKGIDLSSALTQQYTVFQSKMNVVGPEQLSLKVYTAVNHGSDGLQNQNLIGADAVPEPATMAVLAGVAALVRRKRAI
jgi:hypothetical protein